MSLTLLTPQDWLAEPPPFIALWTDAAYAYALYQPARQVAVPLTDGAYPALSPRYPGAAWFERLAHDMNGAIATGGTDTRPAVEQFRTPDGKGDWPEFAPAPQPGGHQLGIGPVHGLITEPAHYRFSLLGEQVLGLQTRLGYSHKGTLALLRGKSPRLAARYAARVSGDATVAHSLAFALAAEAALELRVPLRARFLRGAMAELERLAMHTGDVAAIAAAAGAAPLSARFGWHREALCAAARTAFGHRLMMDLVVPGGVAGDLAAEGEAALLAALDGLAAELPDLSRAFATAALQDRLAGIGVISPALAAAYGAGGVVGRAAGQATDARVAPGYSPYDEMRLAVPQETDGDAAARLRVRLAEMTESARLIRLLLHDMPEGTIAVAPPAGSGRGLGVAESFRGPVWYWLSISGGAITDAFIADASTLHWPLLEQAAAGGDLADFPLLAASINPSGAAVDL